MRLHASCAALDGDAVLLTGPPGAGKSDLLLRLLDRGFDLVADDQVEIERGIVRAPASLGGQVEMRGIGLFLVPSVASARLRLAVRLGRDAPRLPAPGLADGLGVPEITLDAAAASAALRVHWSLDAACGRRRQVCGAFAA